MTPKLIILQIMLCISVLTIAQEKFTTKTGSIKFEASIPNFEPVEATNTTTSAILKKHGDIIAVSLIKGFHFHKALMYKHFNSKKWADSEQYPKAKFVGKIIQFNTSSIDPYKTYTIEGKLTFHGVTKTVVSSATISESKGVIFLQTNFPIHIKDYDIIVKNKFESKITETVNVSVNLLLK